MSSLKITAIHQQSFAAVILFWVVIAFAANFSLAEDSTNKKPAFDKEKTHAAMDTKVFAGKDGTTLPYRLHKPSSLQEGKVYPLVLFFHGAGERGDDNEKQLVHGVGPLLKYTYDNELELFLIAPQCPKGKRWCEVDWGLDEHTIPEQMSDPMTLTTGLLDDALATLPVDKNRVYVTGLSMGGFGTWDLISRRPETFAAAIPVCGGADLAMAPKLVGLPIWAFHGDKDTVVKTHRSRDMISAITKAGGSPHYTECENVGHGSWGPAYNDTKALGWFFAQTLQTPGEDKTDETK